MAAAHVVAKTLQCGVSSETKGIQKHHLFVACTNECTHIQFDHVADVVIVLQLCASLCVCLYVHAHQTWLMLIRGSRSDFQSFVELKPHVSSFVKNCDENSFISIL
jgi:hypothetical protein